MSNIIHSLSSHRIYNTWNNMIHRCYDEKSKDFKYYGERGISICSRWKDVSLFIEDMYPSYKEGLTLDRVDVNGNYEPSNCRWTSMVIQNRNTRKLRVDNHSSYRGVYFKKDRNKWVSQIRINGKRKYIGIYDIPLDAAIAYDAFVVLHGLEHTRNFE